jgi:hypothetical protein
MFPRSGRGLKPEADLGNIILKVILEHIKICRLQSNQSIFKKKVQIIKNILKIMIFDLSSLI